jgi:Flp pilus assembly protein TadD
VPPRSRWSPDPRLATAAAVLLLPLLGLAAYAGSFSAPFLFDDQAAVLRNPDIRRLWPFAPTYAAAPLIGRPVPTFTLALNYALGGLDVRGYHAVNLALHVLAGLALFGVVRRTLAAPRLAPRLGAPAPWLALAVAAIWLVHPLLTESVIYVTQRTELLMGLFYLLTLYCALRAWSGGRPAAWSVASVSACTLAVLSKESAVSAPLMVLLQDGLFVSPSLREALRRHWRLYAGLTVPWAVLVVSLVLQPREQSIGFDQGVSAWEYGRTQLGVLVRYLRLAVWPDALCVDYGVFVAHAPGEIVPAGLVVAALAAGTVWALRRGHPLGFLGAWFFLLLAPSSSFVPLSREMMAERRMYLPLAAVVALGVVGTWAVAGRARGPADRWTARGRMLGAGLVVAVVAVLGVLTVERGRDYASELTIWTDTVRKRPENHRAHNNLGNVLLGLGRADEALAHYAEALRLAPGYASAHSNRGNALLRQGRRQEAIASWEEAIRLQPDFVLARYNLATVLLEDGRVDEAIAHYREAIRMSPTNAEVYNNLGIALLRRARVEEAIASFTHAVDLDPASAEAHGNLGVALFRAGRLDEAVERLARAVELSPGSTDFQANLRIARERRAQGPHALESR